MKLKFKTFTICMLIIATYSFAQTGIGTSSPSPSAKLEVASTNQGFLPPRIALTATNVASPVTSPATGLLVFNTSSAGLVPNNVTQGYYYWNGSLWVRLNGPSDNSYNVTGVVPVENGGTGVTTSTGSGKTVLSNNPTLELVTIASGSSQFPSSINVLPSTYASSKRAALWLGSWGILQDHFGNGQQNFSILQNDSGSYPSRFFIDTLGKIGLGTVTPSNSLHIENANTFGTDPGNTTSPSLYIYNTNNTSTAAHSTAVIRTNGSGGGNPYLSLDINGIRGYSIGIDNSDSDKLKFHSNWNLNNSVTPAMTITNENRIGIGTTNPAAALHVASFVTQAVGAYGYLYSGGSGTNAVDQNINYSIQADSRIRSPEFNAISDARIKKNIFKLNTEKQLAELNKLKVVNYAYIDQLLNGTKNKIGFIAQDVDQVNPQLVNRSTDFIPSVFTLAKSVMVTQELTHITIDTPHGFQKGDEVKLFAEGNKEVIKIIEQVKNSREFSIKGWDAPTENVFVYGKKVTDFRAIDFDQITALSVAAIQELHQQIETLKLENALLNKKFKDTVQNQQSNTEKRLLQLELKLNKSKK